MARFLRRRARGRGGALDDVREWKVVRRRQHLRVERIVQRIGRAAARPPMKRDAHAPLSALALARISGPETKALTPLINPRVRVRAYPPSWLNPWVCQFIGTVGLAAGQLPAGANFKLTSNSGETILVLSIAFLMNEVDRDMSAAQEFTNFLGVIEGKTNSRDENRQIQASMRGVEAPAQNLSKNKFWGFGNGGGGDPGKQAMVVQNLDVVL